MTDEKNVEDLEVPDTTAPTDEAQADKTDYVEFVGTAPHGTEFYKDSGTHTISAKDMKQQHDIDLGKKEVVWRRGSNGRFLVPVSDMTPEAVEVLLNDPMFKKVSL